MVKPTHKNQHLDRLKRGLNALAELIIMALAFGAAAGSMVGGFVALYRVIGWPVGLAVLGVMLLVYGLGIADQRDEEKSKPINPKKE